MAFKLDFEKLGRPRSPEEKEAEQRAFDERLQATIMERIGKIESLTVLSNDLPDWERSFVASMTYHSMTFGISGVLGGSLAELTEKQVGRLNQIHAQFVLKPPKSSDFTPSAEGKECQQISAPDIGPLHGASSVKKSVYAVTFECSGFTDNRAVCDGEMSEIEANAFSETAIEEKTFPSRVRGVRSANISEDDDQGNDSIKVFVKVILLVEADTEIHAKQFSPPTQLLTKIADLTIGEPGNCPVTLEDNWLVTAVEQVTLSHAEELTTDFIQQNVAAIADDCPSP